MKFRRLDSGQIVESNRIERSVLCVEHLCPYGLLDNQARFHFFEMKIWSDGFMKS